MPRETSNRTRTAAILCAIAFGLMTLACGVSLPPPPKGGPPAKDQAKNQDNNLPKNVEVVPDGKDNNKPVLENTKGQPFVESPPREPGKGERYAVLIGVSKYKSASSLRDLQYADRDVEELAKVLLLGGYAKENIILLTASAAETDRQPTRQNILHNIQSVLSRCGKEDSLLVAFAGHGIRFKNGNENYFCPADTKLTDKKSLIALGELYQTLETGNAGFRLMLVDACRSYVDEDFSRDIVLKKENVETVTRPQEVTPPGGVAVFFSCSAGAKAFEHPELKHGVFYHFVIEGLRGKANWPGDGLLKLSQLQGYVSRKVKDYVASKFGVVQTPELFGRTTGEELVVQLPSVNLHKGEVPLEGVLLHHDFQKGPKSGLPQGWVGPDVSIRQDDKGRPHLHVPRNGLYEVKLPVPGIKGDFYVEGELLLLPRYGNDDLHCYVILESTTGARHVFLLHIYDWRLYATLPESNPVLWDQFKAHDPFRFCLMRNGDVFKFSVNDRVLSSRTLPQVGDVRAVRLALGTVYNPDTKASPQLLSLTVGLLGSGRAFESRPEANILLEEDFRNCGAGLPKGWGGIALNVRQDKSLRAYLHAPDTGLQSTRLPVPTLKGDFYLECDLRLARAWSKDKHQVVIGLESPTGPVYFGILKDDDKCEIQMPQTTAKVWKEFRQDVIFRLRLERRGLQYSLSINGQLLQGRALPAFPVRGIYLGLTGEFKGGNPDPPRIYFVKVERLGPPEEPRTANPGIVLPTSFHQKFDQVPVGDLPEGWTSPNGLVSVQDRAQKGKALELSGNNVFQGFVVSPPVQLKKDFFVELECAFSLTSTMVGVGLMDGKDNEVAVTLDGSRKVLFQDGTSKDASKAWMVGKVNRVRLERRGQTFTLKINSIVVGSANLPQAPGEFEQIRLGFFQLKGKGPAPRVSSVAVGPLTTP